MTTTVFNRTYVWLLLIAATIAWTTVPQLYADEPAPQQESQQADDSNEEAEAVDEDGQSPERWQQRVARSQRARLAQRNHDSVRSAFRDVVSHSRQATVEIMSDDEQTALGAIIAPDGFILTKFSEVRNKPLVCQLYDGRKLAATIVGSHDDSDLAMLKINAADLPAIEWSEGEALPVGSWLATTSADELPLAIGVVSVVPRKIDAPSGMLGIRLDEDERGPRIDQVLPDTAAEQAGLQVNDVVLSINGTVVKTPEELIKTVARYKAGDTIRLSILREDKVKAFSATLGDRAELAPGGRRHAFQKQLGGELSSRSEGFPSALQHDTVLKANECGGPLVDLSGKAVGINIARSSRVSSYALPASIIRPLLDDLKSGKLSPQLVAKQQLDELAQTINKLEKSRQDLEKKLDELQQALANALADAEAAKNSDDEGAGDALKDALAGKTSAEEAIGITNAQLKRLDLELQSFRAEHVALGGGAE